jgi:hypothetical protein
VDGRLIHQEDGSDGPLPVTPGRIILNHWGTVGAMPWSTEYLVSATPSVMTVSQVSFAAEFDQALPGMSVGALSPRAYRDGDTWRARVSVMVRHTDGAPVPGVLVTGGFSVGGSLLCGTTASDGICNFTSAKLTPAAKKTQFSVNTLIMPGMTYEPALNAATSTLIVMP